MTRLCAFSVLALIAALIPQSSGQSDHPAYTAAGDLLRPTNYREWIYLSSGLGMNYNSARGAAPQFTNVFVAPWAYREFIAGGKWPEQTIFVVEERTSASNGSINKAGHFQAGLAGLGVEVKDSARFKDDHWAYFTFAPETRSASAMPKAHCWQCHQDHAATEHSFVQFYPTLKPVAQKFGVYREKP